MKIPLRLTGRLLRAELKLSTTILLGLLLVWTAACRPAANLPLKDSEKYRETVRAFYVGLAALQVGDDVRAESSLTRATELVPEEPAAWANLGLLTLRQKNFDLAAERLSKAQSLAPDNGQINVLLGLLESERGRMAEAIAYLRKSVELDPKNLRARYLLAEQIERQAAPGSEVEAQRLMEQLTEAQPENLAALIEVARLSAKRGDGATLQKVIAKLETRAPSWPSEVQEQFKALQTAASGTDSRAAATRIAFLRNVLVRVPEYRKGLSAIKSPPGEEAEPITSFLKLPTPDFTPAPPDKALSFTSEALSNFGITKWDWIGAISFSGEAPPVVVAARSGELQITGGASIRIPDGTVGPHGILALDFNYDFKTDLVYAGIGGVRLYRQDNLNSFVDVTAQTGLSASTTSALGEGAWAADIEADGDLDIVVGIENDQTLVLRNNGDGTFKELRPFEGTTTLLEFIWADLDGDGDADAALRSPQGLQVYANERAGQFRARSMPSTILPVKAMSVGDINSDGTLDVLALKADGTIIVISDQNEGQDWKTAEIARISNAPNFPGYDEFQFMVQDIDNNGSLDMVLSGPEGTLLWLSDAQGKFEQLPLIAYALTFSVADVTGDGRLDLVGLWRGNRPQRLINHGAKNYHWQVIRPRAKQAVGDQRINSFGIGGEMEIRSGLLVQKQLITGPTVHFGLGEQTGADVVRIVWPNGSVRAEFDLKADQEVVAEQRLKGSCPFLFAYDGQNMNFVKDCQPWGAAIGLHIDTLDPKGALSTEEWFKIDGDRLAAKDGAYDLRITAELWETYYYDHLSLMVVDHPAGTDIFVDERFSIPSPELSVRTVEKPRELAQAVDDRGQDVSDTLRTRDGRHLDTFGRGKYQGLTRDHYVEVDLGQDANAGGPLWLIATGWLHPTDASINIAIRQGGHEQPKDLSLEVPDGRGGWVEKKSHQGFPAGRNKTILFDLKGIFLPNTPRRVRLRTNLEVYWDAIWWAKGLTSTEIKTQRLAPSTAELRYRGHSTITQQSESSPETPDYNKMAGTVQRWRDLVGYYTRFGDVRELLEKVDDRYVIMNSGDEMAFKFAAPQPPAAGFVRDFVLIGDGWIKDGDYNSTFSKTVLPLPAHDIHDYTTVASRLEDDPVYRRHPEDWQRYHTRYVTPDGFQNALRTK
ncbi:MAG TPA: FG-GAP-like repeat-containing protein [Pyrinomonadaceae bacterium]|nr:FG-GAP-like repeat-containing protein [Pyrinomonadaceae bacterium]